MWEEEGNSPDYESKLMSEMSTCDEYNDKIIHAIASLEAVEISDNTKENGVSPQARTNESFHIGNQIKLPPLPLPTYSNAEDESFDCFIKGFEAVVNKYNISNYEKFIFLKQLKGKPLTLIKSLEYTNPCYEAAKDLLSKAFASRVT